jgi:ribosome-binding factor A
MGSDRPRRVAEQIQRFLSSRLIPELRDPRLGFATITGVELSRDLRSARVYVTIFNPDPARRSEALAALNHASGRFRTEIAHGLSLRYTPTLRFHEDVSIDRADRIDRLIQEIQRERPPQSEDEQPSGDGASPEDEDEPGDGDSPEDESE